MRISSKPDDPGYGQYLACEASGRWPLIFVDGIKQTDVTTADQDKSFVIRAVTDASGNFVIDETGERVKYETLFGQIEYRWPEAQKKSRPGLEALGGSHGVVSE